MPHALIPTIALPLPNSQKNRHRPHQSTAAIHFLPLSQSPGSPSTFWLNAWYLANPLAARKKLPFYQKPSRPLFVKQTKKSSLLLATARHDALRAIAFDVLHSLYATQKLALATLLTPY